MAGALPAPSLAQANPTAPPIMPLAGAPPTGAAPPPTLGYNANNTALLNLLGGQLNGSGSGNPLSGIPKPLLPLANTKQNSTPQQDIARAMSMGTPISDKSWSQAGLPPGGGAWGEQLRQAMFGGSDTSGTPGGAIPTDPNTGIPNLNNGSLPFTQVNPNVGPKAAPIVPRDPASLVAPTPGSNTIPPGIAQALAKLTQNPASPGMGGQAIPISRFQAIYGASK